jgi:hypothetical protein
MKALLVIISLEINDKWEFTEARLRLEATHCRFSSIAAFVDAYEFSVIGSVRQPVQMLNHKYGVHSVYRWS